jgi:ADP-heptose:LPS heptosyltransferase
MKPINRKLARLAKLLTPLWYALKPFGPQKAPTQQPSSILVFDFHLIGDIVMLTPLLQSLKTAYPQARLVLVAGAWAKEILYGTDLVDEIIPFAAPWVKYNQGWGGIVACYHLVKQLRQQTWDLGIEVRGDIRQILLLWLTGAKRRVGFDFTGGGALLTDVVFDDGAMAHLTEHHQRICEHLGIWQTNEKYQPFLKLTAAEQAQAQNIVPFIGFHFGASLPLRRLPQAEIVQLLSKFELIDCKLVVFLTQDQKDFDTVLTQLSNTVQSKIELWSGNLRQLVITLSRGTHFYCMDSGPAHIAGALGLPSTVFFGPADSRYVRSIGQGVEIISKPDVQCRPCDQVNCVNQVNQYCMVGLADRVHSTSQA